MSYMQFKLSVILALFLIISITHGKSVQSRIKEIKQSFFNLATPKFNIKKPFQSSNQNDDENCIPSTLSNISLPHAVMTMTFTPDFQFLYMTDDDYLYTYQMAQNIPKQASMFYGQFFGIALGQQSNTIFTVEYLMNTNTYRVDVINSQSPTNLSIIGQVEIPMGWNNFQIVVTSDDKYGFVPWLPLNQTGCIYIIDFTNLSSPQFLGGFSWNKGEPLFLEMTKDNSILYASQCQYGITILNISNPKQPYVITKIDTPGSCYSSTALTFDEKYLLAADELGNQVRIFDTSNNYEIVSSISFPDSDIGVVALSNDNVTVYVGGANNLFLADISNITNPQLIGSIAIGIFCDFPSGIGTSKDGKVVYAGVSWNLQDHQLLSLNVSTCLHR